MAAAPGTRSRRHFALTGRSRSVDRRIDAARGDLADVRLAEHVFAPHYAAATPRTADRRTALTTTVGGDSLSEILPGETFEVLELSGGHAWGISSTDGAVGFVASDALVPPARATHIVCGAGSDPAYPVGSRVDAETAARLGADVTRPLDAPVADIVVLAERLVGVPVAPGGRSGAGVDPAGLVFLVLSMGGISAPRFADLQASRLGHAVSAQAPMLRGDLLYFPDHAAIVVDDRHAVHADPAGGQVARIAIAELCDGRFGEVVARRRLP